MDLVRPAQGPRALVVEDAPNWAGLLRAHLEELGCHVEGAGTYAEAVSALDAASYDLLLLDLQLSPDRPDDLDGIWLLQWLIDNGRWAPVIIVTAFAMPPVVDLLFEKYSPVRVLDKGQLSWPALTRYVQEALEGPPDRPARRPARRKIRKRLAQLVEEMARLCDRQPGIRQRLQEIALGLQLGSAAAPLEAGAAHADAGDPFPAYKAGLRKLLRALGRRPDRYRQVLTHQLRLIENIAREQLYGSTESTRAERAEIVHRLDEITLETRDQSFLELCGLDGP